MNLLLMLDDHGEGDGERARVHLDGGDVRLEIAAAGGDAEVDGVVVGVDAGGRVEVRAGVAEGERGAGGEGQAGGEAGRRRVQQRRLRRRLL